MTPWIAACQTSLSITNSWSLLKFMSIEWQCHPTISSSVIPFSSSLQSFPPSGSFPVSQFFSSGGQSIGSLSFSITPSNEYSGLISFWMDWLALLDLSYKCSPAAHPFHVWPSLSLLPEASFPFRTSLGPPTPALL